MMLPLLGQIHLGFFLVPAAAGIIKFRVLSKAMRMLTVLCVLACFNIAAQSLLASWGIRNYFISDYYTILEMSLLCGIFYLSVASKRARIVLRVLGLIFFGIWIVDMVFFHNPDQINSEMAVVSRIFLVVMSLVTLQAAMGDESSVLTARPVFWVAMGVVFYASGTLLVLGLSNELLKLGKSYFDVAWHIIER